MFYLIGLGLCDELDISLRGLQVSLMFFPAIYSGFHAHRVALRQSNAHPEFISKHTRAYSWSKKTS